GTATATPSGTATATATPSGTATAIPTETVMATPTESATPSGTATATPTGTATATPTETVTATPTESATPSGTATATPTITSTATPTPGEDNQNNDDQNDLGDDGQNQDNDDPEDKIKDSLSDDELEDQMTRVARILDSQMNFRYRPVWHGPYDVEPKLKKLAILKDKGVPYVLFVSQMREGRRLYSKAIFFLLNLSENSYQKYHSNLEHKVINVGKVKGLKFELLTRHESALYELDMKGMTIRLKSTDTSKFKKFKHKKVKYRVKIDRVTSNLEEPESIVWFREKSDREWSQIKLDSVYKYRRISKIVKSNEHLTLLMKHGIVQNHTNSYVHNLSFTPIGIHQIDNKQYLVDRRGSIHELLVESPVNEWIQKLFNDQNVVNPSPYISAVEKMKVLKSIQKDSMIYLVGKNRDKERFVVSSDLESQDQISKDLEVGSIIDFVTTANGFLVLSRMEEKTNAFLLDQNQEIIKSLELDKKFKRGKLTVINNTIFIISKKYMTALNFELEEIWSKNIRGQVSFTAQELPSKKLVGIANDHVVIIDPETGDFKQLYSLNDLTFQYVKEIILIDDILYVHTGGEKVYEINLPYHEIAL
ncbi:MAG: hypothetical protein KC493_04910, partial [Bacteriovoracaceae bacterium]|nr:hypothetical protein [Bacteriovoracaceae bacterium]